MVPTQTAIRAGLIALLALVAAACASSVAQQKPYNAFLEQIAAECKPLIIGSDNIGEAIVFNGLGAQPEHYNSFLGQTASLFNGSITPDAYRNAMNSVLGGGSNNDRSFNCIVAHLPKQ